MTETRRKAKIAMLRARKTIKTVSSETGLSQASIHAALSDAPVSRKLRQAICNSLQIELWGLCPTERYLRVPSSTGMQIEFLNAKQARDAVDELGKDLVTRHGKMITFVKDVTFITPASNTPTRSRAAKSASGILLPKGTALSFPKSRNTDLRGQSTKNRKISSTSLE